MSVIITKSTEETKEVAREFARFVAGELVPGKRATVIALSGTLGGGKTTFAQGFSEGLGVKEKVKSPTFILLGQYEIPHPKHETRNFHRFYHLDCYRLKSAKEAKTIGLPEVLENPKHLVLIEWAEKVKTLLPKKKITVKFFHVGENTRKISFG